MSEPTLHDVSLSAAIQDALNDRGDKQERDTVPWVDMDIYALSEGLQESPHIKAWLTAHVAAEVSAAYEHAAQIADDVAKNWAMTYQQFAATNIRDAIRAAAPRAEDCEAEQDDEGLDDCPACDAPLTECRPDSACCTDCSHTSNWPAAPNTNKEK